MISVIPSANALVDEALPATPRRSVLKTAPRLARTAETRLPPLSGESLAIASALAVASPRVLLVCGAEEQRSTGALTADLARALVQLGHGPVLAVEADRQHHSLEQFLHLTPGPGLLDELHDQPFAEDDFVRYVAPNLFGLSLGSPEAVRLAGSHPFATPHIPAFLTGMQPSFPWILFAAPAPLAEVDTLLLARHVEGVILAVERGVQRRAEVAAIHSRFKTAGLPPLSVVLV